MELMAVLGIVFAIIGISIGLYVQITARLERLRAEASELSMRTTERISEKIPIDTSVKLEAIASRLELLETGMGLEPIAEERAQNIDKRLRDIEETLEPFKNKRLEITSTEYQFLIFEIDRLHSTIKDDLREQREDLAERQRRYEIDLDRRIGTFRTIFMVSLTVVGLVVAGFGVLIFFVGRGL
ncbi:hypothetical protein ES703_49309 [subsurface metagenome]